MEIQYSAGNNRFIFAESVTRTQVVEAIENCWKKYHGDDVRKTDTCVWNIRVCKGATNGTCWPLAKSNTRGFCWQFSVGTNIYVPEKGKKGNHSICFKNGSDYATAKKFKKAQMESLITA